MCGVGGMVTMIMISDNNNPLFMFMLTLDAKNRLNKSFHIDCLILQFEKTLDFCTSHVLLKLFLYI